VNPVKQLTGLDASFLYMETPRSFGHVNSLSIYQRPDDPDFSPYEAFRVQLESRLDHLDPFRRRLVEVPFELDHPFWINDPDFDIDFHLRHIAIPPPGDEVQLAEQVARIIGRPMDRTKPLWEVYVLEGLASGDFAILQKIHHATIDGAAGARLLTMLLDQDPAGDPVPPAPAWQSEPVPSDLEVLSRVVLNLLSRPGRLVRWQLRAISRFAEISRNQGLGTVVDAVRHSLPTPLGRRAQGNGDGPPVAPTRAAPATPFNRSITPHRRFAFRSVQLEDVKALKTHLGATVNDVVMAVCAGALRRYLQGKDALPVEPLVSMIPVSIRTGDEADIWTNRVSGIFAPLPTDIDDPVERVRRVSATMAEAKQRFELLPADVMVDASDFAPPALATRAIRVAAQMRIADRTNPPVNLVISNVPGPRHPLYMGGAMLKHYIPVSTVAEGQGLNITVQSYLDTLDFGLVSCRELVPDLWDLVDLCVDEVDVLFEATGLDRPSEAGRRRTARRAAPAGRAKAGGAAATSKPTRSRTSAARATGGTKATAAARTVSPARTNGDQP
jgi:diacylglycerol O-acyltransferase / wax synthase